MISDRTERLLDMQRDLMHGNAMNKHRCAVQFGVSEKTIQRDFETLRSHYLGRGSDLVYDRKADCYRLQESTENQLTKSEVLAVCKILLESRAFVNEELDPILNKLVACCTPVQNLKAVQELIGNERFHYVAPHHGKRFVDRLWDLGEAIREHRVVELTYVIEKLKNREKHKVAFADTREIVDEYIAQKVDAADEISMDDLEKMCAKTPYVAAIVDDETGEITDYEGIKAEETDANFKAGMKQQKCTLHLSFYGWTIYNNIKANDGKCLNTV